jgi:predicted Na+-dependent transporter
VLKITLQLLVPFVAGQIARRWIGDWVKRNARWLKLVDQGSILLVVYTAFSEAVVTGLWHTVSPQHLAGLFAVCGILLAVVLLGTRVRACAGVQCRRTASPSCSRAPRKPGHRRADGPGAVRGQWYRGDDPA